ncbi:hypothetical protein TPHA_0C00420 [Tetrapisispora phaffii CBS 4417]|uniref:Uncharacterized protein n=1 Tax=Tetrapisispora phaffii (strain ATCC 24235 / CBS 4417 / NBRC 1672 / NRRL Y-8282 / UCD 70-5) TaxID=1071381 RepID=G8BR23_TETPH|nr:hypothetical protein TPHA_0C00420 [Tetrapisispora phaffii CBS 4417]CCE62199.1 hypothetical protein TPHA_0C00420 [Tetrapisispora phaffii CBS 4417]
MGNAYVIFGRTVQSHVLAISTLVAVGGITAYCTTGRKQEPAKPAMVDTSNKDDINIEELLTDFLKEESTTDK